MAGASLLAAAEPLPPFVVEDSSAGVKIKTIKGKWAEFKNNLDELNANTFRKYSFKRNYKKTGYILLREQFYEGYRYVLVSRKTGKGFEIDNVPVLSPDRKRLVTSSKDLVAKYNPNAIKIYKISPENLKLEWSWEPKDWGPSEPSWTDDGTVALRKVYVSTATMKEDVSNRLRIIQKNGGWTLWEEVPRPPKAEEPAAQEAPAAQTENK